MTNKEQKLRDAVVTAALKRFDSWLAIHTLDKSLHYRVGEVYPGACELVRATARLYQFIHPRAKS
jgi:hypothetical protein